MAHAGLSAADACRSAPSARGSLKSRLGPGPGTKDPPARENPVCGFHAWPRQPPGSPRSRRRPQRRPQLEEKEKFVQRRRGRGGNGARSWPVPTPPPPPTAPAAPAPPRARPRPVYHNPKRPPHLKKIQFPGTRSGTTCESKFSLVNSILPTIRNEMTPNPYANLILLHTSLLLGTPTALRDQGSESKAPG